MQGRDEEKIFKVSFFVIYLFHRKYLIKWMNLIKMQRVITKLIALLFTMTF